MAEFDKVKFGSFLRQNVSPAQFGEGQCAKHVRLALADVGLVPASHPLAAKDWGPTLESLGFKATSSDGSDARPGDIAVIQPPDSEPPDKRFGHIEGFDGKNWISDFVQQRGFWPGPAYRQDKPAFVVYRWPA